MSDIVLSMNNISKTYSKTKALDNVSIEIKRGDIYGLVGNNGAGKTTLMRIITGNTAEFDGSFELFGNSSKESIRKNRKRIGSLIEQPGFFDNMTVFDNLQYFRIQFGVPGKENIDKILEEVELLDAKKKKYKELSLGMKQKLGIALAIMQSPEFLILDEPINGLDPEGIIKVRNMLLELNKKRNTTILISSHILAEMSNIATKYGFLSHGKLVQQISAEDLMKKCNTYLDIIVDNPEDMCVVLEKQLHYTNYKIYPDNHIHLFEGIDDGKNICTAAVSSGIGISGIEKKSINLENYYMDIVEG